MTKKSGTPETSPSRLIDERIEDLGDWRGEMLSRLRGSNVRMLRASRSVATSGTWQTLGIVPWITTRPKQVGTPMPRL